MMQLPNKNSFIPSILLGIACCLLIGCQYQFGRGELAERYRTVSIPYIQNDQNGELTTEVIKQLSTSGALTYVVSGGDLLLNIKVLEFRDENIGFRYDRKKRGELKKSIIPSETRLTTWAEVSVIDTATGQTIRGPTRITASAEFDHNYYASRHEVNIFSLGQLNDIDVARDDVMHPLNRNLAERIVDYVINSW